MTFTVYSKKLCPYCDKVKKVLENLSVTKGIPVIIYELNTHFDRDQFYSEFGEGSTFPQILLGNKHLGGCSDTVKYLVENNMI